MLQNSNIAIYFIIFLAVEVWLEYLQFSIGNMCMEKDGPKNIRQLFERALTTMALHTVKGPIIWEAFREFETVLLTLVKILNKCLIRREYNRLISYIVGK